MGANAFVAAGDVVIADVPGHALVAGNPARRIGWVCKCGEQLAADLGCGACRRRYAEDEGGLSPA